MAFAIDDTRACNGEKVQRELDDKTRPRNKTMAAFPVFGFMIILLSQTKLA